jgi:phosphoglucosamine mutase
MDDKEIAEMISTYNKEISPEGRIILRASGTEDLIRLSVEARDKDICEKYIDLIFQILREKGYLL